VVVAAKIFRLPKRRETLHKERSAALSKIPARKPSTGSQSHALFDADAAESYPAFASRPRALPLRAGKVRVLVLADVSANLFDAAVNRKVDGALTDLTQDSGRWLSNLQFHAEDLPNEQTDRRSGRWPLRNGCFRTSFGHGSRIGTGSCFDGKDRQEGNAQEGAQEGS
jgi:hypothetical protein